MDWKRTTLLIAAMITALVAIVFRYEVVGVPAGGEGVHGIAYRLDRWTGEVQWMSGPGAGKVEPK